MAKSNKKSGTKNLSVKEIRAAIKRGNRVLNHAGKPLTPGYVAGFKDPAREMKVTIQERA